MLHSCCSSELLSIFHYTSICVHRRDSGAIEKYGCRASANSSAWHMACGKTVLARAMMSTAKAALAADQDSTRLASARQNPCGCRGALRGIRVARPHTGRVLGSGPLRGGRKATSFNTCFSSTFGKSSSTLTRHWAAWTTSALARHRHCLDARRCKHACPKATGPPDRSLERPLGHGFPTDLQVPGLGATARIWTGGHPRNSRTCIVCAGRFAVASCSHPSLSCPPRIWDVWGWRIRLGVGARGIRPRQSQASSVDERCWSDRTLRGRSRHPLDCGPLPTIPDMRTFLIVVRFMEGRASQATGQPTTQPPSHPGTQPSQAATHPTNPADPAPPHPSQLARSPPASHSTHSDSTPPHLAPQPDRRPIVIPGAHPALLPRRSARSSSALGAATPQNGASARNTCTSSTWAKSSSSARRTRGRRRCCTGAG